MRKILILGGGYAGLGALRALSGKLDPGEACLELIDASAVHTVKTRFHEMIVTRGKDRLMRFPIETFTRAAGARFLQAEVRAVDFRKRRVHTSAGERAYDRLLVTLGGRTHYFGVRGASRYCASLQTYEAALELRERILGMGLRARGGPRRRVVVCGAGIEGVEVATIIRDHAGPGRCEIRVLERSDTVMARSRCSDAQRAYIREHFARNRIDVETGTAVVQVKAGGVRTEDGRTLAADLVVWCSGVRRVNLKGMGGNRPFLVNGFLQHVRHPEVFATGDVATVEEGGPDANLMSAQRALYQAGVMAGNLLRLEQGRPMEREAYRPLGELVALGEWDGVGVVGGVHVRGRPAALMKKANEAKYLAELFRDVPGSMIRGLVPGRKGGRPWKTS